MILYINGTWAPGGRRVIFGPSDDDTICLRKEAIADFVLRLMPDGSYYVVKDRYGVLTDEVYDS